MAKKAPANSFRGKLHDAIQEELDKHDGGLSMDDIRTTLLTKFPPDFWTGWAKENLPTLVGLVINQRISNYRTNARKAARTAAHGRAADGHVDDETISIFKVRYHLGGGDPASYTLGSLRGSDHEILADYYQTKGDKFLGYAELHERIARKVGSKRTDEVYTEDELLKLFGKYEYDVEKEATRKVA